MGPCTEECVWVREESGSGQSGPERHWQSHKGGSGRLLVEELWSQHAHGGSGQHVRVQGRIGESSGASQQGRAATNSRVGCVCHRRGHGHSAFLFELHHCGWSET